MKASILSALYEADGYVSGQQLCDKLAVSRTAVWKVMNQLKEEGYVIESVPRKGYRILERPDCVTAEEVQSRLQGRHAEWNIVYYDRIDSSNNEAKRMAEAGEQRTTLVLAGEQTGGKGRRGRVWVTPKDTAIAMSLLLRPSIRPEHASSVTLVMGLAIANACREFCNVDARIKWPNDIVVNGKKICGILTEMSTEIDYINYVVIGVGINVNQETFPDEIKETATSLKVETGKPVKRAGVIATVMERFEQYYEQFVQREDLSGIREAYEACLVNRDRDVRVLDPAGAYEAHAKGINDTGELIVVLPDGTEREIYAGEVSVRGIYGYV